MQMLATKSRVVSTTQHTTQPNTTAISSKGGIYRKEECLVVNSEGGIYLHVLEDR